MSTERLLDVVDSPLFIVAFVVVTTPITLVALRVVTRVRRRLVGIRAAELERVGTPVVSMIVAADIADRREFAVGATLLDLSQRGAVELSHRRTGGPDGGYGSVPYVRETAAAASARADERRLLGMIVGLSTLEQFLQQYLRLRPLTQWRAFQLRRDVDKTMRSAGYREKLPVPVRIAAPIVSVALTAGAVVLLLGGDPQPWMVGVLAGGVLALAGAHLVLAARPLTAKGKKLREQVEAAMAHARVECPDLDEVPTQVRDSQVLAWATLCGKGGPGSTSFVRFFGRRSVLMSSGTFAHWWWIPGAGTELSDAHPRNERAAAATHATDAPLPSDVTDPAAQVTAP